MTTRERAAGIAEAVGDSLGEVRVDDLLEVVRLELGNAEILDGFAEYGAHRTRVVAPEVILHVVSGNTPHGALQSLIRGLLLGSRNRVKLPTGGLAAVTSFVDALPGELRDGVELAETLPSEWLRDAGAVVVFGNDETVAEIRRRTPNGVPFQAHGHRVSLGIVFGDGEEAARRAARDVSLFDQQGCLSPHCLYVAEGGGLTARGYAAELARELAAFNEHTPRRKLGIGEAAEIVDLRASYAFRSAEDVRAQLWASEGGTDWTVVYEEDPWFATSPLNRFVFVKPLPEDLGMAMAPVAHWLAAVGIWPVTEVNAARIGALPVSRVCALGRMQNPPLTWHAEGVGNFASLVKWVDFEMDCDY